MISGENESQLQDLLRESRNRDRNEQRQSENPPSDASHIASKGLI